MKLLKSIFVVVALSAIAACGGGGGNSATPPAVTTPTQAATPASVEVLTSTSGLLSSGSEAVITAFVKNSLNVGMSGQAVTFSTSSGTLQVATSVTDSTGAAAAKLIVGSDKTIRDITVTVAAGTASGNVVVPVTGTTLSLAGNGSQQAGGAATQYTVRAVDSSNSPINKASITVKSSLGNTVSPATLTTDATGSASFLYTPNIAGNDTLTVVGLGTSATIQIVVTAVDFVVVSPASSTSIDIGAVQTIRVRYKLNNVGVQGATVAFNTTRGTVSFASVVTDINGEATTDLQSVSAGPAVVAAQISSVGSVNLPIQFIAATPATIVVQANPGAVLPNSSGTTNQSSIEATVRDANGNPVAGRQVNFTALQDASNGSITPGVATTDLNGRAQVQFIPGPNSTSSNGVIIRATVASTAVFQDVKLTVNGKALFIAIGFGNTQTNVDETTYSKPFSIYVTDANGVAVGNQIVTLSVIPRTYQKGSLAFGTVSWFKSGAITTCVNEDTNVNGVLDSLEDVNSDGKLTPGNVALASPGTVTTDATTGRALFNLQFGEQYAPWVIVEIVARTTVSGTESKQSILFELSPLASDFSSEAIPPAGQISPFGTATLCSSKN